MLGRVPKLGVAELQRKMIDHQRGGYCFEQNMLFRAGLRSLGYRVTSLQGRVVRGLAIDAPRPAIHMLLQVELPQGPYLADVGFGNLAPTAPLVLAPHVEQPTPHGLMRFIEINGELTLQQLLGQRWEHIYRVIPYPRHDAEYEVANWYTATHPDAPYCVRCSGSWRGRELGEPRIRSLRDLFRGRLALSSACASHVEECCRRTAVSGSCSSGDATRRTDFPPFARDN